MSLGIAVIGAGMAGKAHAAAYRAAAAMYGATLPELRYVSIADANAELAAATATRFGYQRSDTSWQAIAAADDIDVVMWSSPTASTERWSKACSPQESMFCARSR